MKRLLILLLSVFSLTIFAQQKKVAVYVTGNDPINDIVSSRLMDGIAKSGKYIAIERTESFLRELSKEQSYQQTGAVDDNEISRLGKQFGVNYVCVASAFDVWGTEKYISTRLIDVETAEVVVSSSSNGSIASSSQLIAALNTLSDGLLSSFEQSKLSTAKKVAVYVSRTGNKDVDIILGDQLVAGFAQSGRYFAIERTQGFLNQLSKEQNYQHTGAVDDAELTRLGKQFGVHYVCIAKTSQLFGDYFISTRLIDVETATVVNSCNLEGAQLSNAQGVVTAAQEIAGKLSGRTIEEEKQFQIEEAKRIERERLEREEQERLRKEREEDFTETAWGINMKMIWVEGGDFLMGCTSEQGGDCESDEQNVRRVTVDGYHIGMLEVTQEQWEKVVGTSVYQQWTKDGNSGSPNRGVGPTYPMYCVSWEEAMVFCRLLSQKTGKTYTLPTEAQWEYAARGGKNPDGTKYSGSNKIDVVGWYEDNSGNRTHPCGTKRANSLGIYDMSGNVREWCKDWYADSYVSYDTNNPAGPSSGSCRVSRGGSWYRSASYCRVASRDYFNPGRRDNFHGFRVVLLP